MPTTKFPKLINVPPFQHPLNYDPWVEGTKKHTVVVYKECICGFTPLAKSTALTRLITMHGGSILNLTYVFASFQTICAHCSNTRKKVSKFGTRVFVSYAFYNDEQSYCALQGAAGRIHNLKYIVWVP